MTYSESDDSLCMLTACTAEPARNHFVRIYNGQPSSAVFSIEQYTDSGLKMLPTEPARAFHFSTVRGRFAKSSLAFHTYTAFRSPIIYISYTIQ